MPITTTGCATGVKFQSVKRRKAASLEKRKRKVINKYTPELRVNDMSAFIVSDFPNNQIANQLLTIFESIDNRIPKGFSRQLLINILQRMNRITTSQSKKLLTDSGYIDEVILQVGVKHARNNDRQRISSDYEGRDAWNRLCWLVCNGVQKNCWWGNNWGIYLTSLRIESKHISSLKKTRSNVGRCGFEL